MKASKLIAAVEAEMKRGLFGDVVIFTDDKFYNSLRKGRRCHMAKKKAKKKVAKKKATARGKRTRGKSSGSHDPKK